MYEIVSVTGGDAKSFLQGQLTQDMSRVLPTNALPAAYCNPQGRVLATLRIVQRPPKDGAHGSDHYELLLPRGIAQQFTQRLNVYRMRSAVVIDVQSRMACGALCDAAFLRANDLAPHATVNACRSNRKVSVICTSPSLPLYEIVGDDAALKALEAPFLEDTNWAEALIRAGCVRVDASAAETFTPHMLSLDLAGAISFSKGCYTGQEIIARTEHRGRSRRRLRRYIAERAGIAAGEALYAGDDTIGTVVNVAGTQLLGIVVDNAEPGPVRAGTIPLDLAALPWE